MKRVCGKAGILVYLMLLSLLWAGCSLQLVAPYDVRTEEHILVDARMVDHFYTELQDVPEGKRYYVLFGPKYREIEAELRSLVLRNKVKSFNEDSTLISQEILDQWVKCKERHRKLDAYKEAIAELDRDRFRRMFEYSVRAEGSKSPAD